MAKNLDSFQSLYAYNQALAARDEQACDSADTCPTITLRDLFASDAVYSGGDLSLPDPNGSSSPADSFAFDRNAGDLRGLADPNQAGIALPDASSTDRLELCGVADTLRRL